MSVDVAVCTMDGCQQMATTSRGGSLLFCHEHLDEASRLKPAEVWRVILKSRFDEIERDVAWKMADIREVFATVEKDLAKEWYQRGRGADTFAPVADQFEKEWAAYKANEPRRPA